MGVRGRDGESEDCSGGRRCSDTQEGLARAHASTLGVCVGPDGDCQIAHLTRGTGIGAGMIMCVYTLVTSITYVINDLRLLTKCTHRSEHMIAFVRIMTPTSGSKDDSPSILRLKTHSLYTHPATTHTQTTHITLWLL